MDCFDRRKRVVLHYLSGRIDIDLYLPPDCFESSEKADQLTQRYQQALSGSEVFRTVQVWFG
ncbi:MAG: cation transporter, partial [Candidatus Thiodiazotropha taylori]|nr:cation transporter [Candidatus Thiodiazotropha taylori]MCW4244228.1 cation transporter [Candidatus Thiodiazotropha taylori]